MDRLSRLSRRSPGAKSCIGPADDYEYKPLNPGQSIRYMVLLPGQWDDPLVCSLQDSTVDTATFEAISYVWGTVQRRQNINCDGKRLKITRNLQDALRRVRLPDIPRNLWADSICINQDDPKERGHQVALMGEIYSKAERVLICLGPDPAGHGPVAQALVDDANGKVLAMLQRANFDPYGLEEDDDPLRTDPRWGSFAALQDLPWFGRGWVVQESGLAKDAILLWGASRIPWAPFMRTWRWARRQNSRIRVPKLDRIAGGLNPVYDTAFSATHPRETITWYPDESRYLGSHLLDVMRDCQTLFLTDERDRVYAFIALAQRITQSKFRPEDANYEQSVLEVYLNFACKYLSDTADLTLLNYAHHNSRTITATSKAPSWCPRWDLLIYTRHITNTSHPILKSAESSPPTIQVLPTDILRTRGVVVDSIAATSETLSLATTIEEIGRLWESWRARRSSSSPYRPDLCLQVLIDCLTCGLGFGDKAKWYRDCTAYLRELFRASKDVEFPQALLELENDGHGEAADVHSSLVACYMNDRKVVITGRGYLALAPGISREGDVIAVIFGTRGPVLLRNSTSREGHYQILGEAFVASKATIRNAEGYMHHRMLGTKKARDWEAWGQEEQDILLV